MDPDVIQLQGATFDLKFDCKPQRFLKSGEEAIVMTASGSIFNFTDFETKPLIRCYGSGEFHVGDYGVKVTMPSTVTYVDIDSDMQDCYNEALNCNDSVTLTKNVFPVLESGENKIQIGSGITQLYIIPRWYII